MLIFVQVSKETDSVKRNFSSTRAEVLLLFEVA